MPSSSENIAHIPYDNLNIETINFPFMDGDFLSFLWCIYFAAYFFCECMIKCTITKIIHDSDVRYIPKVISLSITVKNSK